MLAARSTVFRSMFEANRSEEIPIEETEPAVIEKLLKFIYTEQVGKCIRLASFG